MRYESKPDSCGMLSEIFHSYISMAYDIIKIVYYRVNV